MSIHRRTTAKGHVYDVRLRTPDGVAYKRTFRTRRQADAWQAEQVSDRSRGGWVDPRAGQVTLEAYAWQWLEDRVTIRRRTYELYECELRLHILPTLGSVALSDLSPQRVRTWHADLSRGRLSPVSVAKIYRLLRTVLATAVDDGLIPRNPCRIKNAGSEQSPERPIATVEQVFAIAEHMGGKYRALVLLATFAELRLGELLALTRKRLDLRAQTVTVVDQLQELAGGAYQRGAPKTVAGRRVVALPAFLVPYLEDHLAHWAQSGTDGMLFTGLEGGPLRRAVIWRHWRDTVTALGIPELHLHDLRHTGNTLAASTGASTKELMARMGHSSPQAALRYQHATAARDTVIAGGLDRIVGQVVGLRQPLDSDQHDRLEPERRDC